MGASFVTERKSWPAEGRGREGGLEVAGGCISGEALLTFLRTEVPAGSGF